MRQKILNVLFVVLPLAALLVGCSIDPQRDAVVTNPDQHLHLHLLFESEGCKVYRFSDAGEYIYYTNCGGGTSTTAWIEHHDQVVTEYEKDK